MKIHDISPLISYRLAVFPGDTPFSQKFLMDMEKGHHLTLSSITTTVHLGAHADAPRHYSAKGVGSAERDLAPYLGRCEVKTVRASRGERISPAHLGGWIPKQSRVLFNTGTFPDPENWNPGFAGFSPEVIHFLADRGVVLVGIDTPSIDLADDKILVSHAAVAERNLSVLEGVILSQVTDGEYFLIALPLRVEGSDASPVRAVLLEGALS